MPQRVAALLAVVLACSSQEAPPDGSHRRTDEVPASAEQVASAAEFVGHEVCAGCHPVETAAWEASDHDRAMAAATPESVQGDFGDRRFEQLGVTARFHRVGEEYRIQTTGPSGGEIDYPVKYTFGVRPLQQYLLETEPGRLQAFRIAWDTQAREWFALYPGETIAEDDPLHWTKPAQNWNRNCAECHSTGLSKGYDSEARRYRTSWREVNVSCEACHGAGSLHVAWAEAGGSRAESADGRQELARFGLAVRLPRALPEQRDRVAQASELDVCAPCHSRRSRVYPGGGPGSAFLDHFRPARLSEGLYWPDGQILDEVFVYGSYLQSRMYAEGVRCSQCHDPHTAELVESGNALCARCHEPARFDTPAHHHHQPDSDGAQCVSCHMASRTYMGVDARRDHGFHLPRPDLTEEIGVPNACGGCHAEKDPESGVAGSAAWASASIQQWFGAERPDDRHGARALAAGRSGAPGAVSALAKLAGDIARPGIVRATAFELLARYRKTPAAQDAVRAGLADGDPLVRAAAAGSLEGDPGDELLSLIAPLLSDPVRSVRIEAARVLAPVVARGTQDDQPLPQAYRAALDEYLEGQRALSDWPEARLNLAVTYEQLGRLDRARKAYEGAIDLDPDFVPAHYNLALLDSAMQRPADAERELRRVIELAPEFADGHYSLGLLLAASPARMEEAAAALERAAQLAPDRARVLYNAGIAQQTLGRAERAEPLLRAAVARDPEEPDFVAGLAILYAQQGRSHDALPMAHSWVELAPENETARRLLRDLEQAVLR